MTIVPQQIGMELHREQSHLVGSLAEAQAKNKTMRTSKTKQRQSITLYQMVIKTNSKCMMGLILQIGITITVTIAF
jgi:hypothetical protein